jgi:hypothetical protein
MKADKAESYRRRALACERRGVLASNDDLRHVFFDLAHQWHDMAKQIEELAKRRATVDAAP